MWGRVGASHNCHTIPVRSDWPVGHTAVSACAATPTESIAVQGLAVCVLGVGQWVSWAVPWLCLSLRCMGGLSHWGCPAFAAHITAAPHLFPACLANIMRHATCDMRHAYTFLLFHLSAFCPLPPADLSWVLPALWRCTAPVCRAVRMTFLGWGFACVPLFRRAPHVCVVVSARVCCLCCVCVDVFCVLCVLMARGCVTVSVDYRRRGSPSE
jgi:hypothetical protein